MHNLFWKFTKILSIVKKNLINVLDKDGNLTRPGNKPKFSDAEVISGPHASDNKRVKLSVMFCTFFNLLF